MIVDAAVHPFMPDEEYRNRLPMPWRGMGSIVPSPFGGLFEPPFPEVVGGDDASDARRTAALLAADGVTAAVLTPLTRGLLPNPLHAAAVARATNEWIRDRWLDETDPGVNYFASIRLPVTDPRAAVRELEAWRGDPRFVQVAVPLRVHAQYGNDRYFPIWDAAAEAGMPVYVQDDLSVVTEPVHSPVGQPVYFAENDATRSLLSLVHLASLVTAGVHERWPTLRFVFGDGGLEAAPALLWKLDAEWRTSRIEIPWVTDLPSSAARELAVFVSGARRREPIQGMDVDAAWARVTAADTQLVYGSHLPYWDRVRPADAVAGLPDEARSNVLARTFLSVVPRLAANPALAPA